MTDAVPRSAARTVLGRAMAVPTPLVFVASVVVAASLLWRQGALASLGEVARQAEPREIAATLVLYVVGLALLAGRWFALVRMAGGTASLPASADVFLTSVVVNYAAPIGLAVPTRTAFTTRDLGLPLVRSGAVVGWEALLDVASLAAISGLWLLLGGSAVVASVPGQARLVAAATVGLVLVGAAAVALVAWRSSSARARLRALGSGFVRHPGERPGWAAASVGLTVAYWALQLAIMARLLGAFGATGVGTVTVLGLMGLPVLIGMLSPVPGGAGVREAMMVAAAQIGGIDGAVALLAAVVYRTALFVALPILYVAVRAWRRRESAGPGRGERA